MLVVGPPFFVFWHTRYADMIVRWLLSLLLIDIYIYIYIYDHLPNPWGTQPELVIPELNGGRVKIEVPPSLYISLHSISVSEVVV